MAEPWRIERGDRVLGSLERALRAADEPERAALVKELASRPQAIVSATQLKLTNLY